MPRCKVLLPRHPLTAALLGLLGQGPPAPGSYLSLVPADFPGLARCIRSIPHATSRGPSSRESLDPSLVQPSVNSLTSNQPHRITAISRRVAALNRISLPPKTQFVNKTPFVETISLFPSSPRI